MELITAFNDLARKRPLNGLRGVHLGAPGGEALADALRLATPEMIASMDLYGCELTAAGADPIAHILLDRSGCTSLDLGANALDDQFGASLSPLLWERQASTDDGELVASGAGLRELRLARNRLRAAACTAIFTKPPSAPATSQMMLTSLALSFNPLGAAGGAAVGRALAQDHIPMLRSLQLQGCELGAAGTSRIVTNLGHARAIVHLDLTDNHMGDDGASAVAATLPPTLEELLVGHNALGDAAAHALATALMRKRKCSLRTLVMASNGLRNDAAAAFGEALRGNRTVEHLDLSSNKLGMDAVLALGDALVLNPMITELRLQRNRRIDAEGLKAIGGLLAHNRAAARGGDFERVAASGPTGRFAPTTTQHLFTADLAAASLLGRTPRNAAAASAAAAASRESESLTLASSALREVQHALGESSQEVARLRHKQDALRRALHMEAPGVSLSSYR